MNRYIQQKKEELATSTTMAKKGFLLANIKLSGSNKVNTRRGNYQMADSCGMSMMMQTEEDGYDLNRYEPIMSQAVEDTCQADNQEIHLYT